VSPYRRPLQLQSGSSAGQMAGEGGSRSGRSGPYRRGPEIRTASPPQTLRAWLSTAIGKWLMGRRGSSVALSDAGCASFARFDHPGHRSVRLVHLANDGPQRSGIPSHGRIDGEGQRMAASVLAARRAQRGSGMSFGASACVASGTLTTLLWRPHGSVRQRRRKFGAVFRCAGPEYAALGHDVGEALGRHRLHRYRPRAWRSSNVPSCSADLYVLTKCQLSTMPRPQNGRGTSPPVAGSARRHADRPAGAIATMRILFAGWLGHGTT